MVCKAEDPVFICPDISIIIPRMVEPANRHMPLVGIRIYLAEYLAKDGLADAGQEPAAAEKRPVRFGPCQACSLRTRGRVQKKRRDTYREPGRDYGRCAHGDQDSCRDSDPSTHAPNPLSVKQCCPTRLLSTGTDGLNSPPAACPQPALRTVLLDLVS